ncbi:hypothetical protein AGMMS49579_26010 [Spirochaetia bacterium]|nr:hypothetical protein AGMMS49579_26010 [Spirochaetia bacterium]
MAQAEEYLASLNITQYWARPHTPKDKPFVERLIGTFQRECLDYHYAPMNCGQLTAVVAHGSIHITSTALTNL